MTTLTPSQTGANRASKCRRGVNPEDHGLRSAWVHPAVVRFACKAKAIAGVKLVFVVFEDDRQPSLEHIEKLFTLVRIGIAAAGARRDTEQMRFERGLPAGQQFHLNPRASSECLSVARTNQRSLSIKRVKKIEDIQSVVLRQFPHERDRGAALGSFEIA